MVKTMRTFRLTGVTLVVLAASVLAACGAGEPAASGRGLASWRESVCALAASAEQASDPERARSDAAAAPDWAETTRRQLDAMRELVATLRAIPLPTEHREDAESYVEMLAASVERYEESLPRIEAASRRWDRVLESIDEDSLRPPRDGETVAGGIMNQLMSVPAAREAWNDMMREFDAMAEGVDEKEAERLTKQLGLDQCENGGASANAGRLSADELARCGSRGAPVTLARLVEVFRANGVTLDIDERTCASSPKKRSDAALPDATNGGPSGLSQAEELERREGFVLCNVGTKDLGRQVDVVKYPTDSETYLRALNVDCAVYPHDAASEAKQVGQMKKAFDALLSETR
jgi:hypothetical protein